MAHQRRRQRGRRQRGRGGAQLLRQAQRAQRLLARCLAQALPQHIDEHGVPGHVQLRRQARGAAHHVLAAAVGADGGQQRLARGPHGLLAADGVGAPPVLNLRVGAVGGAAQHQLAQRDQVAFAKEVGRRALGLLRHIDLAGGHARQQFVGRQIDHHHLVGGVHHVVGHRLPHAHAGDVAHDVVQALQVLHVHGAPHVDAGGQQLLHVLPALGVARAGGVAVRQLVEQHQWRLGAARVFEPEGQRGVEVELAQHALAVGHRLERQARQALGHGFGLGAAMRFDQAHHQRHALPLRRARRRQHGVGLAHAGRGAKENLQPAALGLRFVMAHLRQQRVGVGALLGVVQGG